MLHLVQKPLLTITEVKRFTLQTLQQGFWPTPPYRSSLILSGFRAAAEQNRVSALSKDSLLDLGLETG